MTKKQNIKKLRLDKLLISKELALDEIEAEALIRAGVVFVNTVCIDKPGSLVTINSEISVKKRKSHGWVSRGGIKLAHGLDHFSIDVNELTAIDVGCSTGGFTDVLLKNGAKKVYAVDVGYGELAWSLRKDNRVEVLERTNARNLTSDNIPEMVDIIVCDASFIGLKTVLPASFSFLKKGGVLVALIKPQFEVAAHEVGSKGVVRDEVLHQRVCDEIRNWLNSIEGCKVEGITKSPIKGPEGNIEFLIYARFC